MYLFKDNTIVPVKILEYLKSGETTDQRITIIETVVAKHYNTSVHELTVFYKDGPAKIMVCFLLFDMLHYGINGVANRYHIYNGFLKNQITQMYKNCLQDPALLDLVQDLRSQVNAQLQNKDAAALNKVLFNR